MQKKKINKFLKNDRIIHNEKLQKLLYWEYFEGVFPTVA